MKLIRRYWVAATILMMVAVHAAVIGYVRSRVARLVTQESTALEVGRFRFQPVADSSRVYQFELHAVVDPSRRHRGGQLINQRRMEILEDAEQLLRTVNLKWLDDPAQIQIREQLMKVVLKHLQEPLVQRVLITDWLELPVNAFDLSGNLAVN
ncbi:MAG: hypothetical protein VYA84_12485 [Planctomycetota bacterium]|nr:hypothetical protein [Planctomycetota bacterium]